MILAYVWANICIRSNNFIFIRLNEMYTEKKAVIKIVRVQYRNINVNRMRKVISHFQIT